MHVRLICPDDVMHEELRDNVHTSDTLLDVFLSQKECEGSGV